MTFFLRLDCSADIQVAHVLHEEIAALRRALTALERKQDQSAMDTWLHQHGDKLAEVLVVGPDQARPRQGAKNDLIYQGSYLFDTWQDPGLSCLPNHSRGSLSFD